MLEYLDYKEFAKYKWGYAFEKDGTSIWFEKARKNFLKDGYHRKRIGLNHLAFWVESKEDVDKFNNEFLKKNKVVPTFYRLFYSI